MKMPRISTVIGVTMTVGQFIGAVLLVIGVPVLTVSLLISAGDELGSKKTEQRMQSEAIEHGAAYYHPQTRKFTWRDGETCSAQSAD